MKLTRRNFFRLVAGVGAVAALAPKLLIAPKKTWVDIRFTMRDRLLSLDDFEEYVMKPAMQEMAKRIDGMIFQELAAGKKVTAWETRYTINNDPYPKTVTVRQPTLEIDFDPGSDKFG